MAICVFILIPNIFKYGLKDKWLLVIQAAFQVSIFTKHPE